LAIIIYLKILLRISFKKFISVALFLALGAAVSSCDQGGCVLADEFDTKSIKVESNPVNDGVFGNYDDLNGGQVAEWHQTGLRTANEEFIILVSGAWVPWRGGQVNLNTLESIPECNICAKRQNSPSENCICYDHKTLPSFPSGQEPKPEIGSNSKPVSNVDCTGSDQDDPNLCTCTTNNGRADDYGVFHFPLNYYNKDHSKKLPDEQTGVCKYNRGLGLYLGVFGRSSTERPTRLYHLFSQQEVCAITRNANGECIDEKGVSRLKYVFRSKNQRSFVEDDFANNDGLDTNSGDDIYHKSNEFVKLIIYDTYYSDNFGFYNVEFIKGVINDDDIGLLEFLVRLAEDELLGELNVNGEREGGILKFMYNSITKDSNFLAIFQMLLVIYITFFGLASLMGLIELNKKEIYGRILKLSLVMFFVNPNSWIFYEKLVVRFFKDGMESVIDIVVSLGEVDLDEETNPLLIAQLGSKTPGSTGSRFAYVDVMIRTLFSENVTKKIWGLFFGTYFGIVYIPLIYASIFYFLYVMLMAALVYIVTIMKMVFVLAMGPIFIMFSLFKQTNEMFKKWVAFLGARSIEMIILFLLLYTLISLIDQRFNELLHYTTCYESFDLGLFSISILRAQIDRNLFEWLSMIVVLNIFTYMTNIILGQIPTLSSGLISIGGSGGGDSKGSFKLAGGLLGKAFALAKSGVSGGVKNIGGGFFRGARTASRKLGISGAIDKAFDKIPIRGPRKRFRDSVIDGAIKRGTEDARKKGLTGKDRDAHIRDFALNHPEGIHNWRKKNKNKAALYDMDEKKILERIDQKLTKEPLKDYIKKQAKKLKRQDGKDIPLGKDMMQQLEDDAKSWADKNLAGGQDSIEDHLKNMRGLMEKKGEISPKKAAKKFGKDDDLRQKYLDHLKEKRLEKFNKKEDKKSWWKKRKEKGMSKEKLEAQKALRLAKHAGKVSNKTRNFILNSDERRVAAKDRLTGKSVGARSLPEIAKMDITQKKEQEMVKNYLSKRGFENEKKALNDFYKDKIDKSDSSVDKAILRQKLQDRQNQLQQKRDYYKSSLSQKIENDAKREALIKTDAQRRQMIQNAKDEVARLKAAHAREIKHLIGDESWRKALSENGGADAYRDGLVDIDGKTLFEAQAWLKGLDPASQDIASSRGGVAKEEELAIQASMEIDAHNAQIAKELAEEQAKNEQIPEFNALNPKKYEDLANELFPSGNVDLSFGPSIEEALGMQSSNDILSSSNNQEAGAAVDQVLVANFEFGKINAERKKKMASYNKALKEYQLQSLDKEKDAHEIQSLSNEISDLDKQIKLSEHEISIISSQINDAKSGNY
jgi:type IV secretory pathway VirB6-like protein